MNNLADFAAMTSIDILLAIDTTSGLASGQWESGMWNLGGRLNEFIARWTIETLRLARVDYNPGSASTRIGVVVANLGKRACLPIACCI